METVDHKTADHELMVQELAWQGLNASVQVGAMSEEQAVSRYREFFPSSKLPDVEVNYLPIAI
jgi:hypothetical protein